MISELMWRITYRCNKKCEYCFNDVFLDKVDKTCKEKFQIDYIKGFVNRFGIKKIYISGGEPSVVENLPQIIDEVAAFSKVILFTNGYLFEKYNVKRISMMPLDAINITIDLFDIIKKTKHFDSIMNCFVALKETGSNIKINVQIMIDNQYFDVISSDGFKILESIVNRVLWQPLTVPYGSPLYFTTLEGMDNEKANSIIRSLKKNSQGEMFDHIENLSSVINNMCAKECLMGNKYITLNPDMSICICPHMNDVVVTEEELMERILADERFVCERFSMRCFSLYSHLKRRFS